MKREVIMMDEKNNEVENQDLTLPGFYTEKPKKEKRRITLVQVIAIAVICSLIGSMVTFGAVKLLPDIFEQKTYFGSYGNTDGTDAESNQAPDDSILANTAAESAAAGTVTRIAERVIPSVVGIKTYVTVQDFFFGQSQRPVEGTGIIYSKDGYILTNNHVIADAIRPRSNNLIEGTKIEVLLPGPDSKPVQPKIIGRDEKTDLAILKIDAKDLVEAKLGNSDVLRIGEIAVAIGNPGGETLMGTVTAGVISGLNRVIETDDGKDLSLIQTDAAINPGNSGGPLCNAQGEVIGINTIKIVAQGFEGLGFAIPINKAKEIADSLIRSGYVEDRPFLGIEVDLSFDETAAKRYKVPAGVLVDKVLPFTGASTAGIKVNDIIVKINGETIKTYKDLTQKLSPHKPGETVDVEVYRYSDSGYKTFKVKLTEDTGNS